MSTRYLVYVFFGYGLAFFCMGLVVILEGGRATDVRLRRALRPLAIFGLLHGLHEWMEMFHLIGLLPVDPLFMLAWEGLRLGMLSFSLLSLGAFGSSLLAPDEQRQRLSLLAPLIQTAVWGLGLFILRSQTGLGDDLWNVAHVWTRYVLAIPAALLAAGGLVVQQRVFRRAGLMRFGRDALWAAVAFAWYGLVGQLFTQPSQLPPSNVINDATFLALFGFPIELVRAVTATVAAIFVIRFLRAFEVETQHKIAGLQAARLEEAERREALRGELLGQVVAAQEAERQRIARELHDATGQSLTALGLGLRGVETSVRQDPERAVRELRQEQELVASTLDELRHLIADLRPSHLDDLGLAATLRWYAKEMRARSGLEAAVEISGEEHGLSAPLRVALFRIAQEALTNVVKHSGASQARIKLSFDAQQVSLRVEDDGRGFDPQRRRPAGRPSWGLLGMQERVALLGGHFAVQSAPGRGTRVEVTAPLSLEEVKE